jgi:hypothetical protein
MPRTFSFDARGRYYRRHRALPVVTGETTPEGVPELTEPQSALITRWGYQGGPCYRPHDTYVTPAGIWCEIRSVATELGEDGKPTEWAHAFQPIRDRWLRDRHAAQTAEAGDVPPCRVHVVNGRVVAIVGAVNTAFEGVDLLAGEGDEYAAALLAVA